MKRLLLTAFLLGFLQTGIAQSLRINQNLTPAGTLPTPKKIKPGEFYRQSFPTTFGRSAILQLRVRNRALGKTWLGLSVPFVGVSAYELFRQHGTTSSTEERAGTRNFAPYLAGGVLVSGSTLALAAKRKRAYVELSYRNVAGSVVRTEGQWVRMGKTTSVSIQNPPTGWVDVTLTAPKRQSFQVQQMDYMAVAPDSLQVSPVNPGGAQPNKQQPLPNTLPEVTVYGTGGGYTYAQWYDLLTNFADASTIQVTNPYGGTYGDGGGGSGGFSANSSNSGPSTNNNTDYDQQNKCGGLAKMIALSTRSGTGDASKEVFAVLTGDGQLVIFPMNGNTADNAIIPGAWGVADTFDPNTNQINGTQVNYSRKTAAGTIVIQNVVATYHTHQRCLEDGCSGDQPSANGTNTNGTDEGVARALPHQLIHYTLGCCGTQSFKIDQYDNFVTQQNTQYIDDNGNPFRATDPGSLESKTGNACP